MKTALPLLLAALALVAAGHTRAQDRAPARPADRPADRPALRAQAPASAAPKPAPAASAAEAAPDRAELERTQIIGHRELPKVLYIVPWKKPVLGAMGGRAVTSLIDDPLEPVDREVIRRNAQYHGQLTGAPTPAAPNTASDNSIPRKP